MNKNTSLEYIQHANNKIQKVEQGECNEFALRIKIYCVFFILT